MTTDDAAIPASDGDDAPDRAPPVAKLRFHDVKSVLVSMPALRKEMAHLASSAAETYMTYALVGHAAGAPWSSLQDQAKVIASEHEELQKAVSERDIKELRDGIGDLLYTVIGMGYRAGIPLTTDFDEVVRSNLTKFDLNPEEALATQVKYEILGVRTYCQPVDFTSGERGMVRYYITFVDGDQTGSDGKAYPDHKWLKSTKFKDIYLHPLSPSHSLMVTSTQYLDELFEKAKAKLEIVPPSKLYRLMVELAAGTLFLTGVHGEGSRGYSEDPMRDTLLPAAEAVVNALFQLSPEEAEAHRPTSIDPSVFQTFVYYTAHQHEDMLGAFHGVMSERIIRCDAEIRSVFMNMRQGLGDDVNRRLRLLEKLYNAVAPHCGVTYGMSREVMLQEVMTSSETPMGGLIAAAVKSLLSFLTGT